MLQFVMADVQLAALAGTVDVVKKTRERRSTNNASKAKRGDLTTLAIRSILSSPLTNCAFAHAFIK